jgi:translocation and assembly module TamB
MRNRALRWFMWIAGGLLVLTIGVAGLALWSLNTRAGTRTALDVVQRVLGGALHIEAVEGTLAGPLTLHGVRYHEPRKGIDARAREVQLSMALSDLLRVRVHVERLAMQGIAVALSEPTAPPPPAKPFSLTPPVDIQIDALEVRDVQVKRDAQPLMVINAAQLIGSWTQAGLALRKLDVRSPDGEVHFNGTVRQQKIYLGEGRGSFRWTVGQRLYAGTLSAAARDVRTNVRVVLSSPVHARLTALLEQRTDLPWQLSLQVPRFDPREQLLPGSSIQSLYMGLRGRGTLQRAELTGRVAINDEPVQVQHLRLLRAKEQLDVDALLALASGSLNLQGAVLTSKTPLAANLDLKWRDLVIPEAWVGQVLNSAGELQLRGSAQDYRAGGNLSLGPPKRVAAIQLQVRGNAQQVQLERFDVEQAAGRLAMNGRIDFKPQVAWQVSANARRFDPGAFAAAWKGSLDFALASEGRLLADGPRAKLEIKELRGRLRDRQLSGGANLSLTPDMTLAGNLLLRSGQSELRLQGQRGTAMNAQLNIDVPSVNDWLPQAGGKLTGRVTARGAWPDLRIAGQLNGTELRLVDAEGAPLSVQRLGLDFDVRQPKTPQGRLKLQASELQASNLNFATFTLQLEGNEREHRLQLDAPGRPLAAQLMLTGKREGARWSGNLRTLVLDVRRAARLSLQKPVQLEFADQSFSASQACLADRDIRLCLAGEMHGNGVLNLNYSARNVPLGLADALSTEELPMLFSGVVDGDGNVWRSERGELNGSLRLHSNQGQVARRPAARGDEPDVLLEYANFDLSARLTGPQARGSLRAQINRTGSLQGEVQLAGLGGAATTVRGNVAADLPSLSFVELFTPQLANVDGRAQLRATIEGTLPEPRIDGEVRATELTADVVRVGLKLRDGHLTAKPRSTAGEFDLEGGIASGGGAVKFSGVASSAGTAQLKLQGENFLAADMPGAKVVMNPNLEFVRTEERMTLSGDVHLPTADVNLQKLPRGQQRSQAASPDVVIVDAKTQVEAQMQAIPLYATINVSLSDKVNLTGYGLLATVAGRLTVREAPGAPTTGSGQVQVAGTYKAYGQDLTIREGQLLFAGTPIDNPRLNLVAVRQVQEVTAGIRVTGSAQAPQLTVFSDPPMGQSNALSYLVAGKPLSDIGAGEGDGDAVQAAARSLGTAAGGLLAKNIGRRLGVDEVTVKDSEALGGAALTVGQYLSPRLYLSYGVGLFEPGEVLTLRYKLSRDLALEALNGPEGTRAGLDYRREK